MTDLGRRHGDNSGSTYEKLQGNIVHRVTTTTTTRQNSLQESTASLSSSSSFYIINNHKNDYNHHNHYHQQYNNNNYNYNYYGLCLTGGILSSSIRWVLTPLDCAKCLMQVHPKTYPTISSAVSFLYNTKSLYRGFVPTVISYSTQTGTKYMMYEYIKDNLTTNTTNNRRNYDYDSSSSILYQNAIYIVSAFCAEAIADVLMCPWEMWKVQIQTSIIPSSSSSSKNKNKNNGIVSTTTTTTTRSNNNNYKLSHRIQSMMIQQQQQHRRPLLLFPLSSIFGSLIPLWSRQIIGTVFNFLTFENCQKVIYSEILQEPKSNCSTTTQLLVTIFSGYTSGVVSTIVSHPADSIISYKAKYPLMTTKQIIEKIGFTKLATQGLRPRIMLTGSIIGCQWLIYDGFKSIMGMKII